MLMDGQQPVFRFAPSPNGELHLGHAYSALLNHDLSRGNGGRLLVRIEDIDTGRSRAEFEAGIFADLAWLGLDWEEPALRQSTRLEAYGAALAELNRQGLIYPAFMSRREAVAAASSPDWPRDPDGTPHYPPNDRDLPRGQAERRIAAGDPHGLRLNSELAAEVAGPLTWAETGNGPSGQTGTIAADPRAWGDVALSRRDMPTSYHLAVVVDDGAQGVTDIVRGHDLFHATPVHLVLQKLLGLPHPRYCHHRLILDDDGRKLAKTRRDISLRQLREEGWTSEDVRRRVGL